MPIWLKISPEVSSGLQEWLLQTSVLCVEDVTFRRSLVDPKTQIRLHTLLFTARFTVRHKCCSPHTLDRKTKQLPVSHSLSTIPVLWDSGYNFPLVAKP